VFYKFIKTVQSTKKNKIIHHSITPANKTLNIKQLTRDG